MEHIGLSYDQVGKRARRRSSVTMPQQALLATRLPKEEGGTGGWPGHIDRSGSSGERSPAERPREQILALGPGPLSDRELLEAILGSGIAGHPVDDLANRTLDVLDRTNGIISPDSLAGIPGLGKAKLALLCAVMEFGRRHWGPSRHRVRVPDDAWQLVRHMGDRRQEHFMVISLNGAHEQIATRVVSVGLVNRTVVHPREVFADPIVDRASAVIVAHNHPSGSLEPSSEDDEVTRRLREAGALIGIEIIDHLIFNDRGFFSFLQENRLH